MGATCRAALGKLGAPSNQNLKVHEGLHSKIYLSALGAVIGSPNASDNGVGRKAGDSGNLLEAGVFCPSGSKAYVEAAGWFKTLYLEAPMVGQTELDRAPEHSRELIQRVPGSVVDRFPLLGRFEHYPRNFPGVKVVIADHELDEVMAEASRKERTKARGTLPDYVILQNDDEGIPQSFSGPVLILWPEQSVTSLYAYTNCSTWPPSKPDTVFGTELERLLEGTWSKGAQKHADRPGVQADRRNTRGGA